MNDCPRIILKKGRDVSLRHGHPWVFSGALAAVEGKPAPGDVVLAADAGGRTPVVCDRYGGCLVMTIGTAGMEKWRETFIGLLAEAVGPVGIYERSEGRSRL